MYLCKWKRKREKKKYVFSWIYAAAKTFEDNVCRAFFFVRSFLNSLTHLYAFLCLFRVLALPKSRKKKLCFAQIIEPIWADFFFFLICVLAISSSQWYAQNRPHITFAAANKHIHETRDEKNNSWSKPKSNQHTLAKAKTARTKNHNEMVKCVKYSNALAPNGSELASIRWM